MFGERPWVHRAPSHDVYMNRKCIGIPFIYVWHQFYVARTRLNNAATSYDRRVLLKWRATDTYTTKRIWPIWVPLTRVAHKGWLLFVPPEVLPQRGTARRSAMNIASRKRNDVLFKQTSNEHLAHVTQATVSLYEDPPTDVRLDTYLNILARTQVATYTALVLLPAPQTAVRLTRWH